MRAGFVSRAVVYLLVATVVVHAVTRRDEGAVLMLQ